MASVAPMALGPAKGFDLAADKQGNQAAVELATTQVHRRDDSQTQYVRSGSYAHRSKLNVSARLMAAKAAVKERPVLFAFSLYVMAFRVLEMVANCGLPAIMLWWLEPLPMLILFVLLWYLPAVARCGCHGIRCAQQHRGAQSGWWPWMAPLRYPVLLFTIDDFSWLRLHPTQRNAWAMYAVYRARVILLLLVVPLCSGHGSGAACRVAHIINEDELDGHRGSPLKELHTLFAAEGGRLMFAAWQLTTGGRDDFSVLCWAITAEIVMTLSLVWVVVASLMVWAGWCGSFAFEDRHEALLARVDSIATRIDAAMQHDASGACRRELEDLATLSRADGGCTTFQFTSAINPFRPNPVLNAASSVLHMALKVFNVYTFATAGTLNGFASAAMLSLSVLVAAVHQWRWLMAGRAGSPNPVFAIASEVRRSLDSGITTPQLLEATKADKGILILPALVVSTANLPWAIFVSDESSTMKGAQAAAQVAGVFSALAGSGVFVFQQFDLGVEREGMAYEPAGEPASDQV